MTEAADARLQKRRKQALEAARGGAAGGILLAFIAVVGMVYRLAVCDLDAFSMKLVEVLNCEPDLGQGWVRDAIYVGIAVELLLILFFSARMFSGKGFISAVLLFILFSVETGFEIAGGVGTDEWGLYLVWGGFAFGLAAGIWGTWQYRRLNREVAALTKETTPSRKTL